MLCGAYCPAEVLHPVNPGVFLSCFLKSRFSFFQHENVTESGWHNFHHQTLACHSQKKPSNGQLITQIIQPVDILVGSLCSVFGVDNLCKTNGRFQRCLQPRGSRLHFHMHCYILMHYDNVITMSENNTNFQLLDFCFEAQFSQVLHSFHFNNSAGWACASWAAVRSLWHTSHCEPASNWAITRRVQMALGWSSALRQTLITEEIPLMLVFTIAD